MSHTQPGSDDSDDAWATVFDAIEYKDGDEADMFAVDPFSDFYSGMHQNQIQKQNHFAFQPLPGGHTGNPSMDSASTDFFHRRTISSPLIQLTPSQHPYSPQVSLPGVQTTLSFSPSRISRLLAPVDTQARAQEDATFMSSIHDTTLVLNPHALSFIPYTLWQERTYSFGELVTDFFQRKNHASCRFSYKLYNALKLSAINDKFAFLVGVRWLNEQIIRVDKRAFARLLGIKSIDGSLFHQQGNFPSHGFIEVSAEDVPKICPDVDLTGVDYDTVRLLYHGDGIFLRSAQEADLANCKWASSRR